MRAALYARYSSDVQRDTSISDQFRLCRVFVERQGWKAAEEYSDHAITGSTLLLRPGIQRLMQDAMQHRFDVLIAESLDRFSRDQEDTAGLFKRLKFLGVVLVTLSEGEITELHVGFKGTMNALYLKDLADKTRRGLRGRIEAGKSGGGRSYGYRVVRSTAPDDEVNGEREIDEAEAEVVRRIFQSYGDGVSPKQIVKRLNREGVPGPGGGPWGPSTIHGNWQRGTGILNNELYIGRLVWNRLRHLRDPDTGKRVSRSNPPSEWVTKDVPHFRIVSDDVWTAVKNRQERLIRRGASNGTEGSEPPPLVRFRRPRYLFSGLTKCAECGGGFYIYSHEYLACFNARERGTCTNRLTIRRDEVERRVLLVLQEKLLAQDLFEEFCEEFTREMNRLRTEARANLSDKRQELTAVQREIDKYLDAIAAGVPGGQVKERMIALASRQEQLTAELQTTPEPKPLLHPGMARLYRQKVMALREALEREDARPQASEALRELLEAIVLTPEPERHRLGISVQGNLAAMLMLAKNEKRPSAMDDLQIPVLLVAGACSCLDWRACRVA